MPPRADRAALAAKQAALKAKLAALKAKKAAGAAAAAPADGAPAKRKRDGDGDSEAAAKRARAAAPAPDKARPPPPAQREGQNAEIDFFDPSLPSAGRLRKRREFVFVEAGTLAKKAENDRRRTQYGGAAGSRRRIVDAGGAAPQDPEGRGEGDQEDQQQQQQQTQQRLSPHEELMREAARVPDVEWWDVTILAGLPKAERASLCAGRADPTADSDAKRAAAALLLKSVTQYVEHPIPIEPEHERAAPGPQPLKLTEKERKKLRKQQRQAREKEKQELIAAGLMEPPKPKLKISNLMRVLGTAQDSSAIHDPTAVEAEVRRQMAERQQAHIDHNLAMKLTPAERRAKTERKLLGRPEERTEVMASVYRLCHLNGGKNRYKVSINARQNQLTGCALVNDDVAMVVVEGVPRAVRRYGKLMSRRIDWAAEGEDEDSDDNEGEQQQEEGEQKPRKKVGPNWCKLVWEGVVPGNTFKHFNVEEKETAQEVRDFLSGFGLGHYFDLAAATTADIEA